MDSDFPLLNKQNLLTLRFTFHPDPFNSAFPTAVWLCQPWLPPPRFLQFFCSKHLTELEVVAALWETVATLLNTNFNTLVFCTKSVGVSADILYLLWGNKGWRQQKGWSSPTFSRDESSAQRRHVWEYVHGAASVPIHISQVMGWLRRHIRRYFCICWCSFSLPQSWTLVTGSINCTLRGRNGTHSCS